MLVVILIAVLLSSGCAVAPAEPRLPEPCTTGWFEYVEATVSTGDGQGHGPDIGSTEWKSVVEFKLGVRGAAEVPPADSKQWCNYINELLANDGT